ncbi:MAG TPA: hypothetical protein DCQ14_01260 [Firmicutes bacterium]|nr:hypothetical protein [Bacillota bacterium]
MKLNCSVIALSLDHRSADAPDVQKILTTHGCLFKLRVGLPRGQGCTDEGLIILLAEGSEDELAAFHADLKQFPHVKVYSVSVC